ncbi:hypothetical protein [Streptomyces sp. NPDC017095]|uniref:hypothetical protein n=1 Tax=Streptomyces sp. NPDC017095 TaxID=3364977 RepID=UPI00378F0577
MEPVAYPVKKAKEMGLRRCHDVAGRNSCDHVRVLGASVFRRQGKPDLSFVVQTYRDEDTARAAYGTVWKAWKQWVPAARTVPAPHLGDQRDAVAGLSASTAEGSKGLMVQVRVGSVIMLSMAEAGPGVPTADSFADRFAGVFARRAAQAQAGDEPSARLTASAG